MAPGQRLLTSGGRRIFLRGAVAKCFGAAEESLLWFLLSGLRRRNAGGLAFSGQPETPRQGVAGWWYQGTAGGRLLTYHRGFSVWKHPGVPCGGEKQAHPVRHQSVHYESRSGRYFHHCAEHSVHSGTITSHLFVRLRVHVQFVKTLQL